MTESVFHSKSENWGKHLYCINRKKHFCKSVVAKKNCSYVGTHII